MSRPSLEVADIIRAVGQKFILRQLCEVATSRALTTSGGGTGKVIGETPIHPRRTGAGAIAASKEQKGTEPER